MGAREPAARAVEARFLSQLISTVASSLNLRHVLEGVVGLLSDASAVHACFVYLVEAGPERLVLRAASEPYDAQVGRIELRRGEGLAWWCLDNRRPAFIREDALADPRVKYVRELEEERFQSLVAVPVLGRRDEPIGAILLHTEAPREFTKAEADFLVSSASLVAGAIENARLHDETRRRVRELEHLNELAESLAAAVTLEELAAAVVERSLPLLTADVAHLYVSEPGGERLRLVATTAEDGSAGRTLELSDLGRELGRRRTDRFAVSLVAGGELLGALVLAGTRKRDLARTVANQAAVAIKKIELIERLTERNAVADFFDAVASGAPAGDIAASAAALGLDPATPHVVLLAAPANDLFERELLRSSPGALLHRRDGATRVLARLPPGGTKSLVSALGKARSAADVDVDVGLSNPVLAGELGVGFAEARHALRGAGTLHERGGVVGYDDLGAYKYLLRMPVDGGSRDRHHEAIAALVDYDRARSTRLLRTLEQFLACRGSIVNTADALFIHQNTLRQRLRRIMELTGLDLRKEDWLAVEIAVKLASLQRGGEAKPDMPGSSRV